MTTRPRPQQDTTSPDIVATDLNLDDLERDSAEVRGPFRVTISGAVFDFPDPAEVDWKTLLAALSDVRSFFNCLPKGQREKFVALEIPLWKMERLAQGYKDHFGLMSSGEASALS